jgi:2',3'-cyclic-nucleotide 2'-phosphodiesterase (5'-nucleotidase family)
VGGAARRATLIKQERAKSRDTLVLDAGDSLLAERDPAKATRGSSSVEMMNRLGYNAMTLGSQDITLLGLNDLRQRMAEAKFAVLSANAYVTHTQDLVTKPYTVIEMGGHRVGVLGVSDPLSTEEVTVSDPLEAAKKWLPELQSKADIIIVLSHAGLETDRLIADQLSGIDLIVSGGNTFFDKPMTSMRTGTILLYADQAVPGEAGRQVGVAHLAFDKAGNLLKHEWTRVALTESYADDPEIKAWLATLPPPQ